MKFARFLFLSSLLTVCVASSAFAAARAVAPEPIVDVGKVAQGDKVEHSFELRNEGDAVLVVREVKPACGCTVAEFDKSIAAGASGKIKTVLSTSAFSGPIAKSVQVFTNDSQTPEITLVIKAVIQPRIEVDPGYARFIVIEGKGSESSTQTLWTTDGPELTIRSVRSPYPFVKATYARVEQETGAAAGGQKWQVRLTIDRDKAPVGPLADYVEIETNHPGQAIVKIPVSGFVRPELSVTPKLAELGSRKIEAPYETSFEVRNQTDAEILVESVAADVDGVGVEFEEVEKGKLYKVVLTLSPEMAKGPFTGKLQISTTSKRNPLVEIDLSGTIL